jgi:hypothetical protein
MKRCLQNYAVIMPIEKSYTIKFINIKVKSFTRVWHCKTLQNSTQSGSVCPNITSIFRTIAIFKSFRKWDGWNKICGYAHDISLYQTLFVKVQRFISFLHKINVNFKLQPPAVHVIWIYRKSGPVKIRLSFSDLSAYTMSWSDVAWCKFCTHLRSLNVRHFRMIKANGFKTYDVDATFNGPTFQLNFVKYTSWLKSW